MKFLASLLQPIWNFINGIRRVIVNLVFFVLLIAVVLLFNQEDSIPEVPSGGLLVVNPVGVLVEEPTYVSPFDRFLDEALGSNPAPETSVHELISVINHAATDDRIAGVVLDLRNFWGGGLSKLQMVADALNTVRDAGKPIIAHGHHFSQPQYFLASQANQILLNPQGSVAVEGYHSYPTYFAGLLERFNVRAHVFRAGDYKSAVEPYTRNNMSPAAKEATEQWLGSLWQEYLAGISRHRAIAPELTSGKINDFLAAFTAADHHLATLALNAGLVDQLAHQEDIRQTLIDISGRNDDNQSYRGITWRQYQQVLRHERQHATPTEHNVQVLFAAGSILEGYQPQGTVGGFTLANRLRDARLDDAVQAVVLRIDSPGGSAFAAEQIRQELLLLRAAGKPVVASLSSVAASGGYWIAAGADEIIAPPTTITGSIGVFGMFFSFSETLANYGVHTDGVSTSEFPYMDITMPLNAAAQYALQAGVERVYQDFINVVASARNLPEAEVQQLAGGRVWTGADALALGLIDQHGELQDAVARAAELAGIELYGVRYYEEPLSGFDRFVANFFNNASVMVPQSLLARIAGDQQRNPSTLTEQAWQRSWQELQAINEYNDPEHIYLRCLSCNAH